MFFAFFCLGVKMKNPETEAISGFCCNLHIQSAGKEGLLALLVIPRRGDIKGIRSVPADAAYFNGC
jgi:hypothetical protein